MKNNKHIVNLQQIAALMPYAKSQHDKNILVKEWANEARKAIKHSKGVAS